MFLPASKKCCLAAQYWILLCWWTGWRSDVNRSREGETGRSECKVTKVRYLRSWRTERYLALSWKSSFQNKLVHVICILSNSILRRALVMSLSFLLLFPGTQLGSSSSFFTAALSSWLLNCAQQFRLIHPERFCSFRQEPETAYNSILCFSYKTKCILLLGNVPSS